MNLRGPFARYLLLTDPVALAMLRQAMPDEEMPPVYVAPPPKLDMPPVEDRKPSLKTKDRKFRPWERTKW